MEIDKNTLALLIAVAKRDGGDNSMERFAIQDAEQALDAEHLADFPVDDTPGQWTQPALFDAAPYEAK